MAEAADTALFVFTIEAVLRSIKALEQCGIHEHFAGYLAILRASKSNQGLPIRAGDITEFHDRYLRVIGAPTTAPYVRPFKSRGHGLETFNPNIAGSYGPSSLRAKGKLIEVIEVTGERRNATYGLRENHAARALENLLKKRVPVGALATFLYRDYGFQLASSDVNRVINLFRSEFGLSSIIPDEKLTFDTLFIDDSTNFGSDDLELLAGDSEING